MPILFVAAAAGVGWRQSWFLAAATLLLIAFPAIAVLVGGIYRRLFERQALELTRGLH
jgi:hypothetical protein